MKPTVEQFEVLNKVFEYFNDALYKKALPQVMLTLARGKKYHGFFAPERWNDGNSDFHEIALNPNTMDRPFDLVCSTLVHEMVHLWQRTYGLKYPRKAYHNKEFAKEMERIGLMPSATGLPGGSKTGQSMTHYIMEEGDFIRAYKKMPDELKLPFKAKIYDDETAKKAADKKTKVKYSCPGCDINVWGAPDLNVRCKDCNEDLINEEI